MTRLWTDYLKEIDNPVKVTFKNGTAIKVEKDTQPTVKYGFDAYGDHYYSGSGYANKLADELYRQWHIERDETLSSILRDHYNEAMGISNRTKENKDMVDYKKINDRIFEEYGRVIEKHYIVCPRIVNYKYNESTGETVIFWDDKTQTTVKADPDVEWSQYTGFVSACAKKLFGNKSTYLNQFDKWTVKIPARQKAEAEKKAAEDKAREEARAKRAAKRAERRAKRDIEIRAKQLADEYYAQEIEDEAEKIAHEKYGVPKNWFNGYSED